MSALLGRAELRRAFELMSRLLAERRLVCQVYVFGGSAMVLAFDERESTRDVDSRYTSTSAVDAVAAEVARRLGLPRSWLNEQATAYLPREEDADAVVVFDTPNLTVSRASLPHLLAMKADAMRPQDAEDLRLLAAALGVTTAEEVAAVHDRLLPEEALPPGKLRRIREALATGEGTAPE